MRKLLFFLLALASAAAANTCSITLSADQTLSSTTAGQWSNCGGGKPQPGDNISVFGGHVLTLDGAPTFGSGQAPYRGYPLAITGSAGGSTTCGSVPDLGGTPIRGGALGCTDHNGTICTPYIKDRGMYSASGITSLAGICSGGSPTFALTWQAGGGTPAILVDQATSVFITSAVVVRGDVLGADNYHDSSLAVRFHTGGSLVFDFSLSSNVPIYNLGDTATYNSSRAYDTDGTCTTATCSISATGGGAIRMDYAGDGHGPAVNWQHMTLANFGDASTIGLYGSGASDPVRDAIYLIGNKITTSSCWFLGSGMTDGAVIDVEQNVFSNTIYCDKLLGSGAPSSNLNFDFASGSWSSGTRKLSGNVSDVALVFSGSLNGLSMNGNVMQGGLFALAYGGSNTWASASDNAVLCLNGGLGTCNLELGGNFDHGLVWSIDDTDNWHVISDPAVLPINTTYTVFGVAGASSGDSGEIEQVGGNATRTFSYNVILPDRNGLAWAEPGGSQEAGTGPLTADHNYWYADYGYTPAIFGFIDDDEVSPTPSGFLTQFRCNTFWSNHTHSGTFLKIADILATPTATNPTATAASVDYNWGWGSASTQSTCTGCTGQTNGYAAHWTITPGAHDQSAIDPGIDYKRRLETFATDYLHVTASAWSSGASYAKGATASDVQTGIYWGETVIYSCIYTSGCPSGSPRPASGTSWWTYWEPYTLTWLRASVSAGSTFIDGALVVPGMGEDTACSLSSPCDAITALRHWIYAGLAASNSQFWAACPDGTTIGPVDLPNGRRLPLAIATN